MLVYVLYWMISARRTRFNPALQRAAALARTHRVPLLVVEGLGADAPWATPRAYRFILEGMLENARALRAGGAWAHPYLEPTPGAGKGLIDALAARAVAVVTDHFPCGHLPRMVAALGSRVKLEVVDGNGLMPLAGGSAFGTAIAFRRHLQGHFRSALAEAPEAEPLHDLPAGSAAAWSAAVPAEVAARWPALTALPDLAAMPSLDARVGTLPDIGGPAEAGRRLQRFIARGLERYLLRSDPDANAASELSAWLHFGHISPWDIFFAVAESEAWSAERLGPKVTGSRAGWWGMSPGAEAFLDELVTWREVGFQYCHHQPRYADYATLPGWALATLEKHASDPRPALYSLAQLEDAATADPIWNAAQRQLRREGRITNYLRMLWGKRVLEWTRHPREAWDLLIELNNRWAIDGRDPNSYTGIAWTFGRFDRPWGPERPVYGLVRYMSSQRTRDKLAAEVWLAQNAG